MADMTIRKMVDDDIKKCQELWKDFSQDKKKLEELFYEILPKYVDVIEGFGKGLKVINDFDPLSVQGDTIRDNIALIITKLKDFQSCGYDNQRLLEKYLFSDLDGPVYGTGKDSFAKARENIKNMNISPKEIKEITEKIDDIEEICIKVAPRSQKWGHLRPYVYWVSGKSVDVAMVILPLFFNINRRI